MAEPTTRDELILLIEELDRGEARRSALHQLVEPLELALSDTDAVDILQDEDLTVEEIADRLMGYDELDA